MSRDDLLLHVPLPKLRERFQIIARWRAYRQLPAVCERILSLGTTGFDDTGDLREQGCTTIASVLPRLDAGQLIELDRISRKQLPALATAQLTEQGGHVGLFRSRHGWALAAMLSFHPGGRVREAMVRKLDERHVGDEMPFLILRMNDWVKPIQALARQAMERRLRPPMASRIIACIPLFRRLEKWGRTDHREFLQRVDDFLSSPDIAPARARSLSSPDSMIRRKMFRLSIDAEPERAGELWRLAAADPDAEIRRWALHRLEQALSLADRATIEGFLLDRDPVHRHTAQRLLLRLDPAFDRAGFYRAIVDESAAGTSPGDSRLRSALFGMGETGSQDDVARVLGFLEHPHTAIRRAALYAIAWLDIDGHIGRIIDALDDPRRRVSNDAANTLVRFANLAAANRTRIAEIAETAETTGSRGSSFAGENARAALAAADDYQQRWGD